MEWLKEIFKDATDEQVESFKKELPKHFVAKDQYNKKADELKLKLEEHTELAKQLSSNETLLNDLKKKAELSEEYKTKLDEASAAMEQFKADSDKRIKNVQKRSLLERALIDKKAATDAVDLLVGEFDLEKVELSDDGAIKNLDEMFKPVYEKRKSLFLTDTTNTQDTRDGGEAGNQELANVMKAMGV